MSITGSMFVAYSMHRLEPNGDSAIIGDYGGKLAYTLAIYAICSNVYNAGEVEKVLVLLRSEKVGRSCAWLSWLR